MSQAKFGKPLYSTRIIMGDLNPVFEETCALLLTADEVKAEEALSLMLWDSDSESRRFSTAFASSEGRVDLFPSFCHHPQSELLTISSDEARSQAFLPLIDLSFLTRVLLFFFPLLQSKSLSSSSWLSPTSCTDEPTLSWGSRMQTRCRAR